MEMNLEQWRDIPGYEGHYQVSDLGRVRRMTTRAGNPMEPRLLRPWLVRGYPRVALSGGSRSEQPQKLVHRLVLEAFVGPPPEPDMHGAHQDGNSQNPALTNLRWATAAENNQQKREHGTIANGERISSAKLTEAKVLEMRALAASGLTAGTIADKCGVPASTVMDVVSGRSWSHLPGAVRQSRCPHCGRRGRFGSRTKS
jgi:hypothetical protein